MPVPALNEGLWAIHPKTAEELSIQLDKFLESATAEQLDELAARMSAANSPAPIPYQIQNGVAVLQIDGALSKRPMFGWFGQVGNTYGQILSGVRDAQADPAVKAVVLAWDSPGGTVDGSQEAADELFQIRQTGKPMESVAVGQMCSAAEMVGSAAGPVWASSDNSELGSIGVLAMHRDFSQLEARIGIKTTMLTAGKFKGVGWGPLSDDDKAILQESLDHSYDVFKQTVARNRGVSMDAVEAMAEGRVFKGQKAVQVGLARGVATVGSRVAALSNGPGQMAKKAAFAVAEPPTTPQQEKKRMTKDELLAQHPDIADSFRADGRAEGMSQGAEAERKRIEGVLAQGRKIVGHDQLVNQMAFDGKTTPSEAAVAILDAAAAAGGRIQTAMREEAPPALGVTPSGADGRKKEQQSKPAADPVNGEHVQLGKQARELRTRLAAQGVKITAAEAYRRVKEGEA